MARHAGGIVPVERLRRAETDDLEETLREITRLLMSNIMTPAGLRLLRITNAESNRMPEIGAYTYRNGTEQTLDYLADLFQRRLGDEAEEDWREAALAFLNSVISGPPTQTAWGVAFNDESIERHIVYSVRLFLFGLLPRRDAAGSRPGSDALAGGDVRIRELQQENEVLRKLLVDSMLQKEAAQSKRPDVA